MIGKIKEEKSIDFCCLYGGFLMPSAIGHSENSVATYLLPKKNVILKPKILLLAML